MEFLNKLFHKGEGFRPGCRKGPANEGRLLFDFYSAPVATADSDAGATEYTERTIIESEGELYLNSYSGDDRKLYVATPELLADLLKVVHDKWIRKWNERADSSETGALRVIKFADDEGKMIRVSSDNMPSDGDEVFNRVNRIFHEYLAMNPVMIPVAKKGESGFSLLFKGQESLFSGAQETYEAGSEVELIYDLIATDCSYHFFVDGAPFAPEWDRERCGYVIRFVMPPHDTEVYVETENMMCRK